MAVVVFKRMALKAPVTREWDYLKGLEVWFISTSVSLGSEVSQVHARCRCLCVPVDDGTALGYFSKVMPATTLPTMMTWRKPWTCLLSSIRAAVVMVSSRQQNGETMAPWAKELLRKS